jgi:XTP/dITP diphosphohydrolase
VRRLLLATTNRDKVKEIRGILAGLPVELLGLDELAPIEAPEETGKTFEENARLKARYYAAATGLTAIAEDSGLAIDALDGAPGVESARFGGADTTYPQKYAII